EVQHPLGSAVVVVGVEDLAGGGLSEDQPSFVVEEGGVEDGHAGQVLAHPDADELISSSGVGGVIATVHHYEATAARLHPAVAPVDLQGDVELLGDQPVQQLRAPNVVHARVGELQGRSVVQRE